MPSVNGIAFVGPLRAGKSTQAEELVDLGLSKKVSFADALKEEVAATVARSTSEYNEFLAEMHDADLKHKWRTILQWWGTEFRRQRFGEDYWVRKVEHELILKLQGEGLFWVNDDCRFANEYDMLKKHGFKFVRLLPEKEVASTHASEDQWKLFDVDLELKWGSPALRTLQVVTFFDIKSVVPV